jgi:hypothetical protein
MMRTVVNKMEKEDPDISQDAIFNLIFIKNNKKIKIKVSSFNHFVTCLVIGCVFRGHN